METSRLLFTLLTCSIVGVICSPFSPEETENIIKFIDAVVECRNFPGFTISVTKGGDSWVKGFGFRNVSARLVVNEDTVFPVGSLTKAFTSSLLVILLNETDGRYTFETKIRDILGDAFSVVGDFRSREVTLKDILSHRTGLSGSIAGLLAGYDPRCDRKCLSWRLEYLDEVKEFRDSFLYNNHMYMLAGYIIEELAGEAYEDVLLKRIFQPLGMHSSSVFNTPVHFRVDSVAQPYMSDGHSGLRAADIEAYSISPDEPSGAILSSAKDMVAWLQLLLRNGKTPDGVQLLDESLLKQIFDTVIVPDHVITGRDKKRPEFPVADITLGYGYGWFQSTYRGYDKQWHSGNVFAYISLAWLFPDLDIGIFASTNGPGNPKVMSGLNSIFYYIVDTLIGEDPWLNSTTGCSFPLPWRNETQPEPAASDSTTEDNSTNSFDLSKHVGTFGSYFNGDVDVTSDTEFSTLTARYGRLLFNLTGTNSPNVFNVEIIGPYAFFNAPTNRFTFSDDSSNLTISLIGSDDIFTRGIKFENFGKERGPNYPSSSRVNYLELPVLIFLSILYICR